MNPPYGQRIGGEGMTDFYSEIGQQLKHHYPGYTAWILSGDRDGLKSIGLKPFRRYDLLNGDIECRLHGYELYEGTLKGKHTLTLSNQPLPTWLHPWSKKRSHQRK